MYVNSTISKEELQKLFSLDDLGLSTSIDEELVYQVTDYTPKVFDQLGYREQEEVTMLAKQVAKEKSLLIYQEMRFKSLERQKPMFLSFDLANDEATNIPWILENFNAHTDLTVVVGDGNVGKTFMLLDLAFAAISNKPFANQFDCLHPAKVLMIVGEGTQGIKHRIKGACNKWGYNQVPTEFLITDKMPNFSQGIGIVDLQLELKQLDFSPDVIIIDTLSTAMGGKDENSNSNISQTFSHMKLLARPYGASIIVSHHTAKYDDGMFRGASAIRDNADNLYILQKQKRNNYSTLKIAKQRDGKPFNTIAFEIKDNDRGYPYIEWLDASSRKDNKFGKTDKDKVLSNLGIFETMTFIELINAMGKEVTPDYRKNFKAKVLKPLIDSGELLEVEGVYSLSESLV